VTAARDAGVSLAFLTGNTMAWKTRWEPSIDGTNTPFRTLVCYHENPAFENPRDPMDPPIWTGAWSNGPSGRTTDIGAGMPANAVSGQLTAVGPPQDEPMQVPGRFSKLRIWRHTSIENLPPGGAATFPHMLGYEWDADF